MRSEPRSAAVAVRCAVYTRKSSEEGLDQDFNSLDAQREACEAYVRSQVGEGWRVLPGRYDDGGYSGGNIDRPGLQALLSDIDRGLVDIVVVYKIDRLTRSLMDFAKIVERLDGKGASFVSVTQSFNTTTSMGRLTLNVLLSFAQFEREVTSERIRDKLAASKKKGLWMGGNLPLGYDAHGRTLKVNEAEAEQVRYIFQRYLELKSVYTLQEVLKAEGVRSKRRTTKAGHDIGGGELGRGALFHMLSNRVYLGLITHKDDAYPGQHSPILDPETFQAVQDLLASQRVKRGESSGGRGPSPLAGKLFDESGRPMTPTFAYGKNAKRYRYYVSIGLQTGQSSSGGSAIHRLPGSALEAYLAEQVVRLFPEGGAEPLSNVVRIDIQPESTLISIQLGEMEPQGAIRAVTLRLGKGERAWLIEHEPVLRVFLPTRIKRRGGRSWFSRAECNQAAAALRPNRSLINALKTAHAALTSCDASPTAAPLDMHEARSPENPYLRKIASLAFLAPDIQRLILEGRQPSSLTLETAIEASSTLSWQWQRHQLK